MNKNNVVEIGFGPHLTMDLYSCEKDVLNDEEFVCEFLNTLPDMIGMTKASQPLVIKYPGKADSFDKGGVSAYILIAESHITIHTFAAQRHAFIDIFSCKDFDIGKAEKYIRQKFKPDRIDKRLFARGIEFPRNPEAATQIVVKERKTARK